MPGHVPGDHRLQGVEVGGVDRPLVEEDLAQRLCPYRATQGTIAAIRASRVMKSI